MTYSVFAQDEETKPRVDSGFAGIHIVEYNEQPFFAEIVKEALRQLDQTGHRGRALLEAIAAANPDDNRGYNVIIHRVAITYKQATDGSFTPSGGRSFACGAQKSKGVTSDASQIKGKGVSVIVGWCQNQVVYTPKTGPGKGVAYFVPPPVTLGHELIHALHTLKGKNKSGRYIKVDGKDTPDEEAYTVGLGPYKSKKHTENNLRQDFGLPERLSYP